jgi:Transposase DDE domain
VIVDARLLPANVSDLAMAVQLCAGVAGWVLADANYASAPFAEDLAAQGAWLLARPHAGRRRVGDRPRPPGLPRWLVGKRRRVETVIGQLVERYHLKRVWARDGWHLWSRWLRKLLSHTVAVLLCQRAGLSPLRFADLVVT